MRRLTAALLVAGCIGSQLWGQESPAQKQPDAPNVDAESGNRRPVKVVPQPSMIPATPEQFAAAPGTPTDSPLDKFQEFSAVVTGDQLNTDTNPRHIYRSHDLIRSEGPGKMQYFVNDLKTQSSHGLAATGCLHLPNLNQHAFPWFFAGPDTQTKSMPVGKETLDGHECQVEDFTFYVPKHPLIRLRFWEAQDLQGFPIRIKKTDEKVGRKWVIDYTNVVIGPQDPTLFMVPNKCQEGIADIPMKKKPSGATAKKAPAVKPQ